MDRTIIYFPEKIKSAVQGDKYNIDDIGMSGSEVLLFEDKVLKIQFQNEEADNEYKMMEWLQAKVPVPEVLEFQCENGRDFLLMTKIQGKMADDEYEEDQDKLTAILAEGLKMLWKVDIKDCPCNYNLDKKLQLAAYNVEHNLVDVDNVNLETFGENGFKDPAELLKWLVENRPQEELVLAHGDYCPSNILVDKGRINGFIDLTRTGICDKWQDIALCYRSLKDNFEEAYPGKMYEDYYKDTLFEELDIEPDWNKVRYYMLMDELF